MSRLVPRRFTDAASTDIRRTFDRVRWEMKRDGVEERRIFVGVLEVGFVGCDKRSTRNVRHLRLV